MAEGGGDILDPTGPNDLTPLLGCDDDEALELARRNRKLIYHPARRW